MFHAFHSLLLLEKNDFPANKEKALQTLIIRCYNKSTFRADYKKRKYYFNTSFHFIKLRVSYLKFIIKSVRLSS